MSDKSKPQVPAGPAPSVQVPRSKAPEVSEFPGKSATPSTTVVEDSALNFPVVGLGASAGGLEALTHFLQAMPSECGLAFVIVHHADPHHESLMVELLAKHTSMPVTFARDHERVAPNHIYVIPPNSYLALDSGELRVTPPEARHGMRVPIDFFLRSLASAQRERSIAIILSGTGSDGALGVKAVKENGGMVMAQDPSEAGHDGMPRSAIATRAVDHVLPVTQMPARLIGYARHPYVKNGEPPTVLGDRARADLANIIAFLKTQSPINFESYKEGTLLRRIERRMGLRHVEDSAHYHAFLKEHSEEAAQLCKDLLISVTSFFRDSAVFEDLADNVLPDLVRRHPTDRPLRAWVAGCATGEEAYSIAMLLIETVSALRRDVKIQVFASDIDEDALATAREGRYPDSIEADVSSARLQRFFVKEDHTYRVTPELREAIIFARQNLLSQPPFSKLDLILCRNVLIYLNPSAQERILSIFHFALSEGGALVLGLSETVGSRADLFQPISKKHRMFARTGRSHFRHIGYPISSAPVALSSPAGLNMAEKPRRLSLSDLSQRTLLEHYAPAAVLINEKLEVLYFHGTTDCYLRMPAGEPRHALLAMAREGLAGELGGAVREARQRCEKMVRSATVRRDGQSCPVTIVVHPIEAADEPLMLVTFADRAVLVPEQAPSVSAADQGALCLLEQELKSTKQELQSTIADLERSNEELKAANEEAMSMNEEFQATNQELETSREELQSLNEALTTLNAQLQQKIDEERALSDDLSNLLASSDIATVFLDSGLRIKRFTPPATKLFSLIASDVGRPFADISQRVEDPELLGDVAGVLGDLRPRKREIRGTNGNWYNRRILPYCTRENKVDGVVITFADVSESKTAEVRALAAQRFAENIINTVHEPLIVLDRELRVLSASASFYKVFESKPQDTQGRFVFDLDDRQWDIPKLRELLERVIPDKTTIEDFEVAHDFPRLGHRIMLLNARRIQNSEDADGLCLLAIEDVTQRKTAERALVERQVYLGAILATVPDAIITIDEHGMVDTFSPAAEHLFGFTPTEIVGKNVRMLMPEPQRSGHDNYLARYLETGEAKIIGRGREVIGQRKDGTKMTLRLSIAELQSPDRRMFVGVLHDLTEEKQRNDELQRSQKMQALGQLAGGIAHDFNNLLTIIIGNNELLQADLKQDKHRNFLIQATGAAEMGAGLTRRLLNFALRSKLEPTIIRVNDHVTAMTNMLRRTIGDKILVSATTAPDLWRTEIDPGELENVLLNLAINARDAMPQGGTITIETANEKIGADGSGAPADLAPGDYVRLSVIDTGAGMAPEVLKRAAEPFFTTKLPGEGTGLGLASAYGFAKQSGGLLTIASEVNKGTTVSLYLPRALEELSPIASAAGKESTPLGNGELVLVVDDNEQVREVLLKRLESLGYAVIEASNGPEAVEHLRSEEAIALVLSDIAMPGGMTGFEVAHTARKLRPSIKVLLTSGYGGDAPREEFAAPGSFEVLEKPYSRTELAQAVRNALAS